MKKYLILSLVWAWSHSCEASNHAFTSGLSEARIVVLGQEGVNEAMWSEFITHIKSTGFDGQLATKKQPPEAFRGQLTAEFDQWRSNKAVAAHDGLDEDVRKDFEPGALDDSMSSYDGSETATTAGGGSGSVGGGMGSVLSSKVTNRSTLQSMGSPDRGFIRTEILLQELDKLRRNADLTEKTARDARATALGDADEETREANLKAFLNETHLRASYIRVLLLDTTHRAEILRAIVENADYGDFREALIADLVASLPTHPGFRAPVITALLGDAANRDTIAQAFVDSPDFRAVLIRLLEAGGHAIGIARMLWHLIDGANGATFFRDAAAQIVTKAAFDHLLLKTAAGYQAISKFTGQKANFRAEFAAGNQVGKDGRHLGSRKPD